jgi:hypothetical protein
LHRSVQIDLAGFDQLHHRQGRERFGDRPYRKGRLRRGRFTMRAGPAKAAQVHDLVAFDNGQRHAGEIQAAHLLFDARVDRFERNDRVIRCAFGDRFCRNGSGEGPADERQHGTDEQRSKDESLQAHRLSLLLQMKALGI